MVNRETRGRKLAGNSRPAVVVETALLTLHPGDETLSVLQVRRPNAPGWALPSTFLHEREPLLAAALRSLSEHAGVTGLRPRQLHVAEDLDRDDHGWVLSVAHVDVVPADHLTGRLAAGTRFVPVDRPGRLPYGHVDVVKRAIGDVRDRYASRPDPDGLLPDNFSLRDLRSVHETIAGRELQRDTFRRTMQPYLVATGTTSEGVRGRPAQLFTRA